MEEREEKVRAEECDSGRRLLFHTSWPSRVVMPGSEERALVPVGRMEQGLLSGGGPVSGSLPATPAMLRHPLLKEAAAYRWHSRLLEREARKIVFSLCSSGRAGWGRQVELVMAEVFKLMDRDRALRLRDSARAMGVTLERVCRAPIVERPFEFSYQGSRWLMHPVEDWGEAIPFEAHYRKLLLERAGCQFDCWYIAEELLKPSIADRARRGAGLAAGGAGGAILGLPVQRQTGRQAQQAGLKLLH